MSAFPRGLFTVVFQHSVLQHDRTMYFVVFSEDPDASSVVKVLCSTF